MNIGKVVWFTLWQALVSMLLTMLIGLPGAWVFSRFRFPLKGFCRSVISVPFMLPTVVVAAGINAFLGNNGWINLFLRNVFSLDASPIKITNTIWVILFAHVFFNTSLVIRMVSNSWTAIDKNTEDAARVLGANEKNVFRWITLKMLMPSIISAILMVFLFDFTSYGVILLLGGPRFATIETEIAYQTLQMLDLPMSGVLSIIQLVITLAVTVLDRKMKKSELAVRRLKVYDENLKTPNGISEKLKVYSTVIFLMLLTVLPLLSLIFRSIYVVSIDTGRLRMASGFSLIYYQQLFVNATNSYFYVPPIIALINSCRNALLCMLVSVSIGLLIVMMTRQNKFFRLIESFLLLPIGTSAVTLGLGFLLFYRQYTASIWLIPIAHSLIALPFVTRTLQPGLDHIPDSLRQSAALLGAKPERVLTKIDLPLMRRAIINSCIFSFTISMGEFGASSFLSRPEDPTLPVAIFNYLGKPGGLNYGQAMAMSTLLMVFSFFSILLINNDRGKG